MHRVDKSLPVGLGDEQRNTILGAKILCTWLPELAGSPPLPVPPGLPVPGVGGIATDSIASSSSSPKSSMTRRLWKPTLLDLRNCRPTCCPSLRHGERSYADRLIHRPNGASL